MGCANRPCRCVDTSEGGFCSDHCRQRGANDDVGGSCDCGHRACTGEDVPLNDL
jgi:hypothetical protein